MPITIPPPPYKSPFVDRSGSLAPSWQNWFRDLFLRIGGTIAKSNVELETIQLEGLEEVQADITALENSLSSLQGTVTTQGNTITSLQSSINDLLQEPWP
jgi:peptidoglycan hydrolase CwlO-like protein